MAQIDFYKQQEEHQRNELRHWLHITDDDLSQQIFESGYDYLRNILRTDAYGMEQLPATKAFWNMYIVDVWNRIDKLFLQAISQKYMHQYPEWYCVLRDRDTDHPQAIYNYKQLRQHYQHWHACEMSNTLVNKMDVAAQNHSLMKAILHEYTTKRLYA
jgi:hypothetical protein